ncbi:MAG: hypothetical protein R3E58_15875 [Phycisphaerae bacterium]
MIVANDKQKPSAEPVVKGVCSKCGRSVAGFPGDYARRDKCEHMQMSLRSAARLADGRGESD